ncbi:hypothetical protein [Microcoleus sp. S13_C3]|uniref:hypothetical protein n=1 Tax=Microcoleus sp. S13_C3 TaxID=3055409 RepID=UPI002FD63295
MTPPSTVISQQSTVNSQQSTVNSQQSTMIPVQPESRSQDDSKCPIQKYRVHRQIPEILSRWS